MSGATIKEVNKAWLETQALNSTKKRTKLVKCPFSFITMEDGIAKKDTVDCSLGKGAWCKICKRHTYYRQQLGKSKGIVEGDRARRFKSLEKCGFTITKKGTREQIKEMKLEDRR